jgi:hypothetical protein
MRGGGGGGGGMDEQVSGRRRRKGIKSGGERQRRAKLLLLPPPLGGGVARLGFGWWAGPPRSPRCLLLNIAVDDAGRGRSCSSLLCPLSAVGLSLFSSSQASPPSLAAFWWVS